MGTGEYPDAAPCQELSIFIIDAIRNVKKPASQKFLAEHKVHAISPSTKYNP
jgi:hypothetical protein